MSNIPDNAGLYSIGALSKMINLSIDTLRFYDQIGLFKPIRVVRETGYRYYSADQAAALTQIIELKEYGFSLNEIKEILGRSGDNFHSIYLNRYRELQREQHQRHEIMEKLLTKIKQQEDVLFMDKKILLVDDAAFMLSTCRDFLSRAGYNIVGEAHDGLEAVKEYQRLQPDLVLLDIVMPNMDGVDALREIRKINPQANCVMLSALARTRIVAEILMAGAQDFVAKPFQTEDVLNAIHHSFQSRKTFNTAILQYVYDNSKNNEYVLSNQEVALLVQATQEENAEPSQALIELIERLNHGHAPEEEPEIKLHTPSDENMTNMLTLLNKIDSGQGEIIKLLQKLVEK